MILCHGLCMGKRVLSRKALCEEVLLKTIHEWAEGIRHTGT